MSIKKEKGTFFSHSKTRGIWHIKFHMNKQQMLYFGSSMDKNLLTF